MGYPTNKKQEEPGNNSTAIYLVNDSFTVGAGNLASMRKFGQCSCVRYDNLTMVDINIIGRKKSLRLSKTTQRGRLKLQTIDFNYGRQTLVETLTNNNRCILMTTHKTLF